MVNGGSYKLNYTLQNKTFMIQFKWQLGAIFSQTGSVQAAQITGYHYFVQSVQYTLYSAQCKMLLVECAVYSVQYMVFNVQYSVHCTIHGVHLIVYNV